MWVLCELPPLGTSSPIAVAVAVDEREGGYGVGKREDDTRKGRGRERAQGEEEGETRWCGPHPPPRFLDQVLRNPQD